MESEIGPCADVGASVTKAGALHVCAIDGADTLYHTMSESDDTWPYAFRSVQAETRKVGPNPGIGPTHRRVRGGSEW